MRQRGAHPRIGINPSDLPWVVTAGGAGLTAKTKDGMMPKDKDLKRLVRSRMQKTGESYTAAPHQAHRDQEADDQLRRPRRRL